MAENVQAAFEAGMAPQEFIDKMTRNQDKFLDWGERFTWMDEAAQAYIAGLRGKTDVRCLIIAAEWCGDVVRNVPVVLKVAEAAGIETRMLIMEEHLDVMDRFLTYGGRSIPVVLFIDQDGEVISKWGPRPAYVQEPMARFKQENQDPQAPDYQEKLTAARAEVVKRYGEDTGYQVLIVKELRDLLEQAAQ